MGHEHHLFERTTGGMLLMEGQTRQNRAASAEVSPKNHIWVWLPSLERVPSSDLTPEVSPEFSGCWLPMVLVHFSFPLLWVLIPGHFSSSFFYSVLSFGVILPLISPVVGTRFQCKTMIPSGVPNWFSTPNYWQFSSALS